MADHAMSSATTTSGSAVSNTRVESLLFKGRMPTMARDREKIELLRGTLDMLILRTLLIGPAHGHQIAKHIQRSTDDVLQVEHGSLYPALHRLSARGG